MSDKFDVSRIDFARCALIAESIGFQAGFDMFRERRDKSVLQSDSRQHFQTVKLICLYSRAELERVMDRKARCDLS